MLGPERARDAAGLVELGAAVIGEISYRERLHAAFATLLAQIDHLRGDAAGVETAGEEHAHRHVRHQPRFGCVLDPLPEVTRDLRVAARVRRVGELALPVAPDLQLALFI